MIKTLSLIAGACLLVSAVTLAGAAALTGPAAIARGAWSWGPHGWGTDWDATSDDADDTDADSGNARASRQIGWGGGDTLTIEPRADVQITRGAAAPSVTVSGRPGAVDDLEIKDGVLRYKAGDDHDARLTVVVAAPGVTHLVLEHRGAVTLVDAAARR